jgi:hypothetical protein
VHPGDDSKVGKLENAVHHPHNVFCKVWPEEVILKLHLETPMFQIIKTRAYSQFGEGSGNTKNKK